LDNKTLSRLESAVSKSQYVGQGKKLKVTNKVRFPLPSLSHPHTSSLLPPRSSPALQLPNDHRLTNGTQVNPDILGGLVVEIGDRTIDLSVSSRIAKMNKLLTDTL
jgi:F-type H+-transporting ATPase subunit O